MGILEYFPFKTFREQQREVLEEIGEAYSSGFKYLLLEAPTGFGKSPVGVCAARHLHTGHLVTATKQLQDELSRFQIIVKVPYPDLSDMRVKVKMEKDRRWYDWQTALRLVQTYGRSVRSKEDYADTYILDSQFIPFMRRHPTLFPKWFTEALRPVE